MIPTRLHQRLKDGEIEHERLQHRRAVGAQELAEALQVSGWYVAKTVVVDADGKNWMAVLPAPDHLDLGRFAAAVNARYVRLLDEDELARIFSDCEVGAEPPFGSLYGLPCVLDQTLASQRLMICRAGSHEECVALSVRDYCMLEQPMITEIGLEGVSRGMRQSDVHP